MESPDVTYLRIEWKIKNIFSVDAQESEQFRFRTSLWKLIFETFGFGTFGTVSSFKITLNETRKKDVLGDFVSRVFIVDENRTPQFLSEQVCEGKDLYYFDGCVWSVDVKDFRRKAGILSSGDVASFVCILMSKTTSDDEDTEKNSVQASMNGKAEGSCVKTLVLDFRRLLDDNALSDVTLKCGDRTILAHRLILSARSEVFAAMLRYDMAESRTGIIEVTNMDPSVLEQLLQFIYSCKMPDMSIDTTPQLYEAADNYGVESLKKVCSAFMKENLREDNACCILHLADSHGDSDLKDCAVSFIVEMTLYKKDDIWLKFCKDHPTLAVEVLNRVCKSCVCQSEWACDWPH